MSDSDQPGLLKRFLGYVVPYSMGFVVAILGLGVVAATEPALAYFMEPMLDGSFVDRDPKIIKLVPVVLLLIFVVRGIGSFFGTYCMTWVARNVVRDMRQQVFEQLLSLPARFYDKHASGHLSSKLIYDVEQVARASSSAITIMVRDSLTIVGLLGFLLYKNWKLTMFFVVVTPLITFLVIYISKRFRKISRRIQKSMGNVTEASQHAIRGYREIKVFGGEEKEKESFRKLNELNRKQHLKIALTSAASIPIAQLLAALALAGVLYVSTNQILTETHPSPGEFMSFMTAALLLLRPMKQLTKILPIWQNGMAAAQSIFELLDQPQESNRGKHTVERVKGAIQFEHVTFSYTEDRQPALNDVNLTIRPGETVAIVGKSGSGKSTLINMIPRFYDSQAGNIFLDDVKLQDYDLQNLRKHIAIVNQDIMLFNDTVLNNIAYGGTDNISDDQVVKAAEAAHVMEFIDELPEGLNSVIGDRGVLLSGGQRQRIAIARAILKDSPILILDEATSALDTESERLIQNALEALMKNRTTLVIAHRLSTIEKADNIVVMNEGRIVEQGNHSGLLSSDGHYAALYRMQFREAASA